jgi:hypothetical protein
VGKFSRDKGKRGELDVVHKIPGAKRTGLCGAKTFCDVTWPGAACQVKNCAIGGTAIADNLEHLVEEKPDDRHYVIFKGKRGTWIIAQTLQQWLEA